MNNVNEYRMMNIPTASECPQHIREAIERYFSHRVPPGSFVRAVLANDLIGAHMLADQVSLAHMPDICAYLYQGCPALSYGQWGSYEFVDRWLAGWTDSLDGDLSSEGC